MWSGKGTVRHEENRQEGKPEPNSLSSLKTCKMGPAVSYRARDERNWHVPFKTSRMKSWASVGSSRRSYTPSDKSIGAVDSFRPGPSEFCVLSEEATPAMMIIRIIINSVLVTAGTEVRESRKKQ